MELFLKVHNVMNVERNKRRGVWQDERVLIALCLQLVVFVLCHVLRPLMFRKINQTVK